MELSEKLKDDIEQLININMDKFHKSAVEYNGLIIAFATTDGKSWGFNTGTIKFPNGAYGYEYWATYEIQSETAPEALYNSIIGQLEKLVRGY